MYNVLRNNKRIRNIPITDWRKKKMEKKKRAIDDENLDQVTGGNDIS